MVFGYKPSRALRPSLGVGLGLTRGHFSRTKRLGENGFRVWLLRELDPNGFGRA